MVHDDWERYYVNRFVDRDMLLRYLGGAVGHGTCVTAAALVACEAAGPAGVRHTNMSTDILDTDNAIAGSNTEPSGSCPNEGNNNQDKEQEAGNLDEELNESDSDGYDSDVPFALL
ncbi:hypothetical protein BC628DRAFT_1417774 [Trametes gibbosa]|nr:hypothetical protein BC628DRAFT_1421823 [Trametes gibbosa]KAI0828185.1 hypothetical protein BC628DRAFT_1417774 [Trametes gibbosa]